jgi:hypothetical protein
MSVPGQNTTIDEAFRALMASMTDMEQTPQRLRSHSGIRVRRDLPQNRNLAAVPRIPMTYEPISHHPVVHYKETLLKLAAFEATYYKARTPISPDMVPLIIDTGASITVSPYKTDFISPIKPVQSVEIKGIASGLQVCGYGDVSYTFYNDNNELQPLTLRDCLYIPQCMARLLCPRQIGQTSSYPFDGLNAASDTSVLTYQGKHTTIAYDTVSHLPILSTAPGISTFRRFCANQTYLQHVSPSSNLPFLHLNLTPRQQRKLHLHERCAHAHWDQINT